MTVTSDPMLAVVPFRCRAGHYLRDHVTWIPGAIIRGSMPCLCEGARTRKPPSHAWVQCAECLESAEWREPPCSAGAEAENSVKGIGVIGQSRDQRPV